MILVHAVEYGNGEIGVDKATLKYVEKSVSELVACHPGDPPVRPELPDF